MEEQAYPCPSCGFIVFEEPPGSYAICPICGWEDDHVQLRHPLMGVGANKVSLFEAQQKILKEVPPGVRECQGYLRSGEWRPLDKADLEPGANTPETGIEYFHAAAEDSPPYYWERVRKVREGF